MKSFENHFFSTAEGRAFCCTISMPFKKNCKITLTNNSGKYINNLFYDINLTLEDVCEEDMYFCASFNNIEINELEQDVEILKLQNGTGRFLGASIGVIPNEEWYGDLWWGEGEVKIYLDGDCDFPALAGTGAEDYIGSAWKMETVIKTYREWKLSGDNDWLKLHWDSVKKALEYAWSDENKNLWDNNKDGVLEGRQHHTLDVELSDPSSWLQSMYLSALLAASKMARVLKDTKKKSNILKSLKKARNGRRITYSTAGILFIKLI